MYNSSITSIFLMPLSSSTLFKDNVDANKFSSIFAIGTEAGGTSFFALFSKKFKLSKFLKGICLKITFFFHHYTRVK